MQLLARSRYLLFKSREKWSESQKIRTNILFSQYPELEMAYNLTHKLRYLFNQRYNKDVARLKLAHWYNEADDFFVATKHIRFTDAKEKQGKNPFNSVVNSIRAYSDKILNFFNNRSTNAAAECFNSKLKSFRADLRGVCDVFFFLYRVSTIFAK